MSVKSIVRKFTDPIFPFLCRAFCRFIALLILAAFAWTLAVWGIPQIGMSLIRYYGTPDSLPVWIVLIGMPLLFLSMLAMAVFVIVGRKLYRKLAKYGDRMAEDYREMRDKNRQQKG